MGWTKTIRYGILFSAFLFAPASMITLLSPQTAAAQKQRWMKTQTLSIWTPGHVTGRALKTLRMNNELITVLANISRSSLVKRARAGAKPRRRSSASLIAVGRLRVAALYHFKLIFPIQRRDALFADSLSRKRSPSAASEWTSELKIALSLSLLYFYISVQRGGAGGLTSGRNGSAQRLIHNNHQWLWERTGHSRTNMHTRTVMQELFECIANPQTRSSCRFQCVQYLKCVFFTFLHCFPSSRKCVNQTDICYTY